MDQGDLIGSGMRGTVPGSGLIVYNSPYAHYHYVGWCAWGARRRS